MISFGETSGDLFKPKLSVLTKNTGHLLFAFDPFVNFTVTAKELLQPRQW